SSSLSMVAFAPCGLLTVIKPSAACTVENTTDKAIAAMARTSFIETFSLAFSQGRRCAPDKYSPKKGRMRCRCRRGAIVSLGQPGEKPDASSAALSVVCPSQG